MEDAIDGVGLYVRLLLRDGKDGGNAAAVGEDGDVADVLVLIGSDGYVEEGEAEVFAEPP